MADNLNRRPRRHWQWLALIALGIVILVVGLGPVLFEPVVLARGSGMKAIEFPSDSMWLNTPAPLTIEGLKGRVVLVDFWTYCCINCLHAMPVLQRVEEHFAGRPFTVIGVHSGKFDQEHNDEKVRQAIAKYNIAHPVLQDDDFTVWNAWGVRAWPTLILVDETGSVAKILTGEPDFENLRATIEELVVVAETHGASVPAAVPVVAASTADTGALRFPGKVLATADRLFIADSGHHRIVVTDRSGHVLETIGGPESGFVDGDLAAARFREPQGMALHDGVLYVADRNNHAIRAVDLANRTVATIAGTGRRGDSRSDRGLALAQDLRSPWALLWRDRGLDIAMAGSHQIWRLDLAARELSVIAGTGHEQIIDGEAMAAAFAQPSGLYFHDGALYVADSETSAIRRVDLAAGRVETLVGTGLFDFGFKDGKGKGAQLQHPLGVTGHDGVLYIADSFNNALRTLDTRTLEVSTPKLTGVTDFNEPSGVSLVGETLLVADTNHHRVVAVDLKSGVAREIEIAF